jgi:UDP-N-acetylmuramate dehydrogenase
VIEYLEQKKISSPTIKDVSNAVAQIRMSKLPDVNEVGNAGSFFKNPVINIQRYNEIKTKYPDIVNYYVDQDNVKVPAGWLIEKCGWKGKRAGSVGTYPKQALVIINYDNAAGAEVLEFAMRIKGEVESKFGIILEEEVNII